MLIKKVREVQCHLIKHWIATMLKWRNDWNIQKISWPTCWTIILNSLILRAELQSTELIQLLLHQMECLVTPADKEDNRSQELVETQNQWTDLELVDQASDQAAKGVFEIKKLIKIYNLMLVINNILIVFYSIIIFIN